MKIKNKKIYIVVIIAMIICFLGFITYKVFFIHSDKQAPLCIENEEKAIDFIVNLYGNVNEKDLYKLKKYENGIYTIELIYAKNNINIYYLSEKDCRVSSEITFGFKQ